MTDLMRDAERVESAFRRSGKAPDRISQTDRLKNTKSVESLPIEIWKVTLKKLSVAERDVCRK